MDNIAVYPGTFDPITLGHLSIIERAAKIFRRIIIAVDSNNLKKTLFTCKIRAEIIRKEIIDKKLKNIEVKIYTGLLVKFVLKNNSNLIIRGLRNIKDLDYELNMSTMNRIIAPKIETIFLPTTSNTQFISSSIVKEILSLKGDVKKFIPNETRKYISRKYKQK